MQTHPPFLFTLGLCFPSLWASFLILHKPIGDIYIIVSSRLSDFEVKYYIFILCVIYLFFGDLHAYFLCIHLCQKKEKLWECGMWSPKFCSEPTWSFGPQCQNKTMEVVETVSSVLPPQKWISPCFVADSITHGDIHQKYLL